MFLDDVLVAVPVIVAKAPYYDQDHAGAVPEDLLSCFRVLKKCMNKLDCLVNQMLYIKQLTPRLNVQRDSIQALLYLCKFGGFFIFYELADLLPTP